MVERERGDLQPGVGERWTRSRLQAERRRLTRLIAGLEDEGLDLECEADSLGEITPVSQHPADVGSETFERERDLSLLAEFRAEVCEVEEAIARLAGGSYGRCANCRAPISAERLAAVPATRYCKVCQDHHELHGSLSTESAYVAGGIAGDPAEFLPSDDEPEAAPSDVSRAAEEQAIATYTDAELSQAEQNDELAARGLFDRWATDRRPSAPLLIEPDAQRVHGAPLRAETLARR